MTTKGIPLRAFKPPHPGRLTIPKLKLTKPKLPKLKRKRKRKINKRRETLDGFMASKSQ